MASDEQALTMQGGDLTDDAFAAMPSDLFFDKRVLFDVTTAHDGHPTAWTEIGFGGPASPRGLVIPTNGGVNPHLAIQVLARRGER